MKTNITWIISNINKALGFEWVATHLDKDKFNLNFILLYPEDSEMEKFLVQNGITAHRISYSGKKDIPRAAYLVFKILKKSKAQVVHTHLFDANIVGLTAAWLAGVSKRIYTRHHSKFHHVYYPRAVKYDKVMNFIATDIVAISKVVESVLIKEEHVPERKVHLVHHGFLMENFLNVSEEEVNRLSLKYNQGNSRPVVGVISRYIEWKGIQYIIPAFKKLLSSHPNALLILAGAQGNYKDEIQRMLQAIPQKNYLEIPFENNLYTLYKLFDIFIHVPIDGQIEAFGQTYVEALASGVPAVFTLSGIANEFIVNEKNALVVDYKNSEAIYEAMMRLLNETPLRERLIQSGKESVRERFSLQKMMNGLEKMYLE